VRIEPRLARRSLWLQQERSPDERDTVANEPGRTPEFCSCPPAAMPEFSILREANETRRRCAIENDCQLPRARYCLVVGRCQKEGLNDATGPEQSLME
jgi:hypothetical protein